MNQQIDWDKSKNPKLFIHGDCMEHLKTMPDKYIDLAIVDPPFGGGNTNWESEPRGRFGGRFNKYHIGNQDRRDMGGEVQPRGHL